MHRGKATAAGRKMLGRTLLGALVASLFLALPAQAWLNSGLATMAWVLGAWLLLAAFILWFFRDPDPDPHPDPESYLAPAHGVVDIIDEVVESEYLAGTCKRISIFLSVFDVHVQNAPVEGQVAYHQHHPGEFLNAMSLESAASNENLMFGFASARRPGERVAVRLIAGLIARRIVPWVKSGDVVAQGQRISLIQFGSRVTVYLPANSQIQVKLKQRVQGGRTVLATTGKPS